ncbi:hypothetical protein N7532_011883 [Penicillium argentinense]|uniref:Uncharacterized protein n=1 Tax=Penicillium argentinense TaxID=1131581 RepID=A0A9W9EJE6_9EURO|nr:uncharacterized protein N7532_011883 [Penicillium argentinense]KAJ5082840.1 hypothetical protein N7532_011883 [Penicillium argentinense]
MNGDYLRELIHGEIVPAIKEMFVELKQNDSLEENIIPEPESEPNANLNQFGNDGAQGDEGKTGKEAENDTEKEEMIANERGEDMDENDLEVSPAKKASLTKKTSTARSAPSPKSQNVQSDRSQSKKRGRSDSGQPVESTATHDGSSVAPKRPRKTITGNDHDKTARSKT